MSARSFRSVFMVASCAGAALGCYLVSLRVASERASLEDVETKIVLAQRDLRVLQTEIGTRGRLAQLERWNVKVLALSAPSADQLLGGSFELARLARPERKVEFDAPVVLAAAPAPGASAPIGEPAADDTGKVPASNPRALFHEASLKISGTREVPAKPAAVPPASGLKSTDAPAAAAKPDKKKSVDKPGLAAAKPVTKEVRMAKVDPLAPLQAKPATPTVKKTPKDSAKTQ
ncbi:hypothetical protein [Sphingomonas hankyongi]|uniref:Uncharacterized protein n=1 Tax=Sphingomonas hankyongi TaxID=2908209 RepID=A0ABT0RZE5_9SPHN|nr:hypothetical protein [Sphingomonas hankyongi]MCL6728941.1 hypothetical protein [Sphingomonas hankyongi]